MNKTPIDMLGNLVNIGDVVVSYNNLYNVLSISNGNGNTYMKIKLVHPSATTRSINRYHRELVVVTSLINKEFKE